MGLDGISPIQLRQLPEVNSAELNSILKPNENLNTRMVDGLSKEQKVDPDKENHKQDSAGSNSKNNTEEDKNEEEEKFNESKIDLSQTNKYELKLNESSNSIVIAEKATNKVIQVINADTLAVFVKNLAEGKGAIVNRKF